jgi:4-amino-4-deoxychorismate lyase
VSMISSEDRGLHYGDGLFETITCMDGQPRWLVRHLARLRLGCERLGIAMPDEALLQSRIAVAAAGQARSLVKLIVTRGVAPARGYRPTGTEIPTVLVQRYPWPAPVSGKFVVDIAAVRLGENPLLAGIKHLNRLEQVLAQQQAGVAGVSETLMRATSGGLICGSMTNLFLCEAAALITPGVEQCGVAGVMRGLVMDAARALAMPLHIEAISPARMWAAPAAFVTNVRLGLQTIDTLVRREQKGSPSRDLATDERQYRLQDWINAHSA